jgi:hypothetical protein
MVSAVLRCSIVIAEAWPEVNRVDLAARRDAREAEGLISVSEESWPQVAGSTVMRAIVSIEATNAESIRWYAREVLRLRESDPAWSDMERQLAAV